MAVDRTTFSSSNLAAGAYDAESQEMVIEFTSGAEYKYLNVPEMIWSGLKNAGSAGSFFHRSIRDRYAYEQM